MLSEILAVSFLQKQMKFLVCPKCGIRRFHVKDKNGNVVVVQITTTHKIVPVNKEQSLDGFDLNILYCLGCSWKGSKEKLLRYLQ
jgi:hypothetical protein